LAILLGWTVAPASPSRAETVLRICDDVADPATLDPQKEFTEKNHTLVQQIYEGLVQFSPDGKLEPCLAESWERVGPLRMRFHLRKGVKFHNGEPFTAEAVRWTMDRYLNPATGFPGFGFLGSIDKAEVVDDYTVDILTKFPDGLLLNRLAAFIVISPPAYAKQKEGILSESPVGTGPFKFEKWEKGDRIVLVANKDYWMSGFPKVSRLVFLFRPFETQFKMLLDGKIDLMTEYPGTRTIQAMENKGTSIVKRNSFWTVGAAINISKPPLSDVRVRRAMNMALDVDEIIHYESLNNGKPIATFTMKGEEGHNASLAPYGLNREKAKKLLAEAGVSTPIVLKTLVREQGARVSGAIKAQLEENLGIKLDIHVFPDAEVIKALHSEEWDLTIAGLPDPMCHSFFIGSILLYSKSPFAITRSSEFDQKLEAMMTVLDDKERDRLGRELDAYVYNQALGLFTFQRIKTYGVNERLKFIPSVTGMHYFYKAYFMSKPPSPKKAVWVE